MSNQDSNVVGRSNLASALATYGAAHPQEAEEVARFTEFVSSEERCYERDCWRGHVTGASWLVNGAGTHVLLTHHRKLDKWLQLGGHSDGDPDTTAVALREAREESGLAVELLAPTIFDIDSHPIPARKGDPEHWHFDVRFVMRVVGSEAFVVSPESIDLAWVPMATLAEHTRETTLLRMRDKYLQRAVESKLLYGSRD